MLSKKIENDKGLFSKGLFSKAENHEAMAFINAFEMCERTFFYSKPYRNFSVSHSSLKSI